MEKFFLQGWTKNDKRFMELTLIEPLDDNHLWQSQRDTMRECAKDFLNAKIGMEKHSWTFKKKLFG